MHSTLRGDEEKLDEWKASYKHIMWHPLRVTGFETHFQEEKENSPFIQQKFKKWFKQKKKKSPSQLSGSSGKGRVTAIRLVSWAGSGKLFQVPANKLAVRWLGPPSLMKALGRLGFYGDVPFYKQVCALIHSQASQTSQLVYHCHQSDDYLFSPLTEPVHSPIKQHSDTNHCLADMITLQIKLAGACKTSPLPS